jgi:hypothetical protein
MLAHARAASPRNTGLSDYWAVLALCFYCKSRQCRLPWSSRYGTLLSDLYGIPINPTTLWKFAPGLRPREHVGLEAATFKQCSYVSSGNLLSRAFLDIPICIVTVSVRLRPAIDFFFFCLAPLTLPNTGAAVHSS